MTRPVWFVMLFGAVDFDRIRVPDTGQGLAGGQERHSDLGCRRRRQEANDDVAVEVVGGADDAAERAGTERAQKAVRAPRAEVGLRLGRRLGIVVVRPCARQRRVGTGMQRGVGGRRTRRVRPVGQAAMEFGDVRDDAELPEDRALSLAAEFGFERGPIHFLAIGKRCGQIREPAISAHARKCLIVAQVPRPPRRQGVQWDVPVDRLRVVRRVARHVRAAAGVDCFAVFALGGRDDGAPLLGRTATRRCPTPHQLIREVKAALRTDEELLRQYTFRERRRDVKVTKLGKVQFGPWREFEVYPSEVPGETYKRLISVDDVPLTPAVLERRDAEHRKTVLDQLEQIRVETPAQRQKRLAKKAKERQEEQDVIDDVFAVYDIAVLGREIAARPADDRHQPDAPQERPHPE